jgi:thiamine-phosphate pyrophosphorylase
VSAAAHRLRGIYAILGESGPNPVVLGRQLLEGGIRIVQYRAKDRLNAQHANALRALTYEYDALFILNDDWRAVDEFDADGVHLGPDDVPAADLPAVRERLKGRIVGLSCGNREEAFQAQRVGADYIGVGCVYPTRSKADAGEPIGIAGLHRVAAASSLPVAAIGGITMRNAPEVAAAGVAMAALLSEFAASADPAALARKLVTWWPA